MKIDVRSVMKNDGEVLNFKFSMPLSGELLGRESARFDDALVEGAVKNAAGAVTLSFEAAAVMRTGCDRCLEPVETPLKAEYAVFLTYEKQNPDDDSILLLEGDVLELDEMVYDAVYLVVPSKVLCRPDCKGLCPHCGVNLNREGGCSCGRGYVNPAFAAIRDKM